jgi:predicted nicotinamide N-methyase
VARSAGGEGVSEQLVNQFTQVARVALVPELALHLLTEAHPLFFATEAQAASCGLLAPFWAFAWPGGQALARLLLDRPALARGRRVLDFGSGGAIEGLAAARAGARSVLCADIDPVAADAARLNAALNGLAVETTHEDVIGADDGWDLVLCGDVFFEAELGGRVRAWLDGLARRGATVLVGDPSRGHFDPAGQCHTAAYDCEVDGDTTNTRKKQTQVWQLTGR